MADPMFRRVTLIRTPLMEIVRTDHMPDTLRHGTEEERESSHAVTFVEAGGFGIGAGNSEWTLREGSVMVSRPAAVYRYTHARDVAPDVCVCVHFARESDEECDRNLAGVGVVPRMTNRLAFLRWQLTVLLPAGDALAVDAWGADLLRALQGAGNDRHRLHRLSQLRWYAERVEAVRRTLEERYAESHTLTSLAASVAISPFQFARVFQELIGCPPHQYLMRVRLANAHQMLLDGASVTDACYDAGFSSLSHFIHMFKRRFGYTPSATRRCR